MELLFLIQHSQRRYHQNTTSKQLLGNLILFFIDFERAIGSANRLNPLMLIVPCHRVIGADGNLVGFAGGLPMKEVLLKLESGKAVTNKAEPQSKKRKLEEPAVDLLL